MEGSRIALREAVWPDGSRVILDSRGLLHFVSSAPEVEDFSVILAGTGRLSLWSASLGGVGDPYYFNGEPMGKPGDFAQLMLDSSNTRDARVGEGRCSIAQASGSAAQVGG